MSKRFTDTDKWKRPWFRSLATKHKLLWVYICDECDIAGIWYKDLELASFLIGVPLVESEALDAIGKQINILEGGSKWLIKDFTGFQYGELVPNNNLHRAVMSRLAAINSGAHKGLKSPSAGDQVKDKDKVKDKDRFKDFDVAPKIKSLNRHLDFVLLSDDEFQKLYVALGPQLQAYLERLNGYIGQIGPAKAAKKYVSHYHTILNWHRKDIAEGKNGAHDGKSAHHVSSPKEWVGSLGKTPAELRIILDDAKSKEFSPGLRDHALAAESESEKPGVDHRNKQPNGGGK